MHRDLEGMGAGLGWKNTASAEDAPDARGVLRLCCAYNLGNFLPTLARVGWRVACSPTKAGESRSVFRPSKAAPTGAPLRARHGDWSVGLAGRYLTVGLWPTQTCRTKPEVPSGGLKASWPS